MLIREKAYMTFPKSPTYPTVQSAAASARTSREPGWLLCLVSQNVTFSTLITAVSFSCFFYVHLTELEQIHFLQDAKRRPYLSIFCASSQIQRHGEQINGWKKIWGLFLRNDCFKDRASQVLLWVSLPSVQTWLSPYRPLQ